MTVAFGAVLPMAGLGPNVGGEEFRPVRDLYRIAFPEREGVDGTRAPGAAILVVAIAHGERRTRGRDLDSPTKAAPLVLGLI